MKTFYIWMAIALSLGAAASSTASSAGAQSAATDAAQSANAVATSPDVSGTWIAKRSSPMGEMEIVYKLQVHEGKITGTQFLPFGDSPIVDGEVTGDSFHFTVELDSFGTIQQREVTGKIVGDTLVLTPAMPSRPSGNGPGGGPAAGGRPGFQMGPVTARRGIPTPTYRAPSVDYAKLERIALPAVHPIPANSLAKTPPMGWNSWNKFRTNINDATVRGIADAMAANGMKDAGYRYVIIDDGWQGKRDERGALSPNPNFPDMKALAAYVHSKGLLIGIYSSPGPRTCGGFEGSYGHEVQDAQMYAAWGMDYLKYDWCSASRIWKDEDMQAAYQKMGEALEKTGKPIVYALCQYGRAEVQKWGKDVGANLWRTTNDIRDQYDSMAKIGFAQSDLSASAGPGHWNDPDMLEIGNGGMSTDEYKTHFSHMNPDIAQILLNKDVIAIDQDSLGAGGKRVNNSGDIEIWEKPLASGEVAVAIFNHGTQEVRAAIPWDVLEIKGKYSIQDLWAHTSVGTPSQFASALVPAHGVILLRLNKRK